MNQQIRLLDQVHAHRPDPTTSDAGTVTVVQRWSGFSRNRHALVIVTGAAITTSRVDTPTRVRDRFDTIRRELGAHLVTEFQAWTLLTAAGVRRPVCQTYPCGALLPAGGLYCPSCGTVQHVAVPVGG